MNNALTVLKQTFGFLEFRPPQDEIISCLISGGDAMVIMPTGGGKSLCYQIPAIVRPGCGVVISPLIALMQNQVDALHELGVRANFLNSTLDRDESLAIEQALLEGELDLLYIAPERLVQPQMLALLKRAQISLFAIDEAHCVSQWGHDFRVDYLQLSLLHREFPGIPRIALTATADSRTREEIIQRLNLGAAGHFFAGFDRPNIRYTITLKQNTRVQLLRFLNDAHRNDAGIIYCLSRKKTEETAVWLQGQGFSALPYHAGLSAERRALNQTRFLREESVIIVATIAFGMGIDKPDVRFVAHLDLPKTIESYYQETGRAGRDGLPADAWMIYGLQDVIKLRQMMEGSDGSAEFKRLEQHRLNAMLGLCEITSCRRHALLAYFDEVSSERCENCDTCLSPVSTWDATDACRRALSVVFRTGQRFGVNHVIDVLRGTATPKVSQFDHQLLPVFGLGKELVAEQWRSVFRQLVARGFLSVNVDAFGALQLEEKSRPLLRGEITLELRRDLKTTAAKQQTRTPISNDIDVELWEALRECRRVLAETQRVPPYVIFSNNTLQAMAEQRPQTIEAFSQLSGVGERKRDKYGPAFLEVLRYAQG
jgi:ATP-dependent DNA helicase RecQ